MIFYKLDYTIEKILKRGLSREQKILQDFVGQNFTEQEAKFVWERVLDHKWFVSESLERDIGLRAAAADYVENFYKPRKSKNDRSNSQRITFRVFSQYDYFGGFFTI